MVGDILSHCLVEQSIYERCRPFAMSQPSNKSRNVTKFFNTENFSGQEKMAIIWDLCVRHIIISLVTILLSYILLFKTSIVSQK